MVVEEKSDVDVAPEIKPDAEGKYPETVAWKDYVGVKESLGKKLDKATQKVTDLEEQAKNTVNAEEHTKVKTELDEAKTKLLENTEAEKTRQESKLSEMRNTLIAKGVSKDKVKDMSEQELASVELVLGVFKPKADMDGGGGASDVPSSSKDKMSRGFELLHPTK